MSRGANWSTRDRDSIQKDNPRIRIGRSQPTDTRRSLTPNLEESSICSRIADRIVLKNCSTVSLEMSRAWHLRHKITQNISNSAEMRMAGRQGVPAAVLRNPNKDEPFSLTPHNDND